MRLVREIFPMPFPKLVAGPRIGVSAWRSSRVGRVPATAVKRSIDVLLALLALLASIPFILLVSAAIVLIDGRPVFFVHQRVGFRGRRFGCLKFRTMVRDSDRRLQEHLDKEPAARAEWEETRKLRNDPRILPVVGAFLRKSSLDELPQFLNVLIGEMSLVGPRPVPEDELEYYGDLKGSYMSVRPGLTGPWQVGGRSDVGYEERIRLDDDYARNWSVSKDIRIMLATPRAVLLRRGAV